LEWASWLSRSLQVDFAPLIAMQIRAAKGGIRISLYLYQRDHGRDHEKARRTRRRMLKSAIFSPHFGRNLEPGGVLSFGAPVNFEFDRQSNQQARFSCCDHF